MLAKLAFFAAPLLVMQLFQYVSSDLLVATKLRPPMRSLVYGALLGAILLLGARDPVEFIYFQF